MSVMDKWTHDVFYLGPCHPEMKSPMSLSDLGLIVVDNEYKWRGAAYSRLPLLPGNYSRDDISFSSHIAINYPNSSLSCSRL